MKEMQLIETADYVKVISRNIEVIVVKHDEGVAVHTFSGQGECLGSTWTMFGDAGPEPETEEDEYVR